MATGRDILRFARRWERKHPGQPVFQLRVALYQHFLGATPADALTRDLGPYHSLLWVGDVGLFVLLAYPFLWLWELVVAPSREKITGRIEAVLRMIEEERQVV